MKRVGRHLIDYISAARDFADVRVTYRTVGNTWIDNLALPHDPCASERKSSPRARHRMAKASLKARPKYEVSTVTTITVVNDRRSLAVLQKAHSSSPSAKAPIVEPY